MKKTVAVLICLLLIASLAISALAVESIQMILAADSTSVYRGDTVTFTISIPEVRCVSGMFLLEGLYDEGVFEFVEGHGHLQAAGDVVDGNNISGFSNVGYITDKLSGTFTYAEETKTSGVIFTIKMKVKADADFGKTEVAPTVALRDAAGNMTATINAVEITVVCDHQWSAWTKANGTEHSRQCSVCQETETEAHSFTEKLRDEAHLVPGTEATYYYDCAHCDMMSTETFDGSYTVGDLDGNEVVDIDDAVYLALHTMMSDVYKVDQPVDFDSNGKVDIDDAIYLVLHTMMPGSYPLER